MREVLSDIRTKLLASAYRNEEHVRLSLVARVVQALGWDIWDPREVDTEFYPAPNEDKSRVDMALCVGAGRPAVFVEVKPVGKADTGLAETEKQLRDYNLNFTAKLSVITDGRKWRFYYIHTEGAFSQKCFKVIDLLEGDLDNAERFLTQLLSKTEVADGRAEEYAKDYLKRTRKQLAMEEALPDARRMAEESPRKSLAECLVEKVKALSGLGVSLDETVEFIQAPRQPPLGPVGPDVTPPPSPLDRERPSRLHIADEVFNISNWYDILTVTAEWLIKRGKLSSDNCPVRAGHKRYLVHTVGKHSDGSSFGTCRKLSNGLFMETKYGGRDCVEYARRLLDTCGFQRDMLDVQ